MRTSFEYQDSVSLSVDGGSLGDTGERVDTSVEETFRLLVTGDVNVLRPSPMDTVVQITPGGPIPDRPPCQGVALLWEPGREQDRERFYRDDYDLL